MDPERDRLVLGGQVREPLRAAQPLDLHTRYVRQLGRHQRRRYYSSSAGHVGRAPAQHGGETVASARRVAQASGWLVAQARTWEPGHSTVRTIAFTQSQIGVARSHRDQWIARADIPDERFATKTATSELSN
jgi:hypothetical protein